MGGNSISEHTAVNGSVSRSKSRQSEKVTKTINTAISIDSSAGKESQDVVN